MQVPRRVAIVLIVVVACALVAVATLELEPVRSLWQHPEEVVRTLAIQPGQSVADLGAGGGYFLPYLADAVGVTGTVYAVDVDADVTDRLRQRFAGNPRVQVVLGRQEDPGLPDASVDLVLVVNVFHHIQDREEYFSRLSSDLAERGRVAIIEPNAALEGFFSLFISDEHVSFSESIVDEMRAAGYRHSASYDFLPVQVFEVFVPVSQGTARTPGVS